MKRSRFVLQPSHPAGPAIFLQRKPEFTLWGIHSPVGNVQITFPVGGNVPVEQGTVDESVMVFAGEGQRGDIAVDFSPDGEAIAEISGADFRSPIIVS